MAEDDGRTLSERLRDLKMREASESDEAAVERAAKEKASLYERMKDLGGARERPATPPPEDGSPVPPQPPGDGAPPGGDAPDDEGDGRDDEPDEAEEAIRSFVARADTLSGRLMALRQEAALADGDEEAPLPEEPDEEPTVRSKALDWFLGRARQHRGSGTVTPIPAYDAKVWEEMEFYGIEPPYSFVRILRHRKTQEFLYEVIEPELTEKERHVLEFVEDALVRGLNVDPGDMEEEDRLDYLVNAVRQILADYMVQVDRTGQRRVEYFIRRDFLGLGAIHVLMRDQSIEDISCDGAEEPLFVFHRDHESIPTNVAFDSEAHLDGFVIKLAQRSGKSISISDPILDAALPDGSRLQATLGQEVTQNGSTFTIRRFKPDPFTPMDLVNFGTMDDSVLAWFWLIVQYGASLIFSGGTASGKTTALNAISQFIPYQSKIVSIEDTREVNLPHRNWIKSTTRSGSTQEGTGEIGMFELLKAALRQRPEYILVGEVRGIEATVAFQAMATGHTVYATMHADSARSVVYRLENDPINIPRLVLQALDVIAIQAQVRHGGKRVRRIKEVVELVGMDPSTRELLTNTVFTWRSEDDGFRYGGRSYLLERIATQQNWSEKQMAAEFERRKTVVRWLRDGRRVSVEELGILVRAYYRDPKEIMEAIEAGTDVDAVLREQGRLEAAPRA